MPDRFGNPTIGPRPSYMQRKRELPRYVEEGLTPEAEEELKRQALAEYARQSPYPTDRTLNPLEALGSAAHSAQSNLELFTPTEWAAGFAGAGAARGMATMREGRAASQLPNYARLRALEKTKTQAGLDALRTYVKRYPVEQRSSQEAMTHVETALKGKFPHWYPPGVERIPYKDLQTMAEGFGMPGVAGVTYPEVTSAATSRPFNRPMIGLGDPEGLYQTSRVSGLANVLGHEAGHARAFVGKGTPSEELAEMYGRKASNFISGQLGEPHGILEGADWKYALPPPTREQQFGGPLVPGQLWPMSKPSWVREGLLAQGKNPGRMLNDVDLGNPSVREALLNDPMVKSISDPQLRARAMRGDLSVAEFRAALKPTNTPGPPFPEPPPGLFAPEEAAAPEGWNLTAHERELQGLRRERELLRGLDEGYRGGFERAGTNVKAVPQSSGAAPMGGMALRGARAEQVAKASTRKGSAPVAAPAAAPAAPSKPPAKTKYAPEQIDSLKSYMAENWAWDDEQASTWLQTNPPEAWDSSLTQLKAGLKAQQFPEDQVEGIKQLIVSLEVMKAKLGK